MRLAIAAFTVVIWSVLLTLSWALECWDCEGSACSGNCSGDVCVRKRYRSRWGDMALGPARDVRGCYEGSPALPSNTCTVYGEPGAEQSLDVCACDTGDMCNDDVRSLPAIRKEKVECYCDALECRLGRCMGESCLAVRAADGSVHRDCHHASSSLVEDRALDGVFQPPLTAGLDLVGAGDERSLGAEAFLCSRRHCNRHFPDAHHLAPRLQRCPLSLALTWKALKVTAPVSGFCFGQYCWNSSSVSHGWAYQTLSQGFYASGCLTLHRDPGWGRDIGGCATFSSSQLSLHSCLQPPNSDANESLINRLAEESGLALGRETFLFRHYPGNLTITLGGSLVIVAVLALVVALVWHFDLLRTIYAYTRFEEAEEGTELHSIEDQTDVNGNELQSAPVPLIAIHTIT